MSSFAQELHDKFAKKQTAELDTLWKMLSYIVHAFLAHG